MKIETDLKQREVNPEVVNYLGFEVVTELLGIARDLRSGVIPPEMYDQFTLPNDPFPDCSTPCCILGHLKRRLDHKLYQAFRLLWISDRGRLCDLFNAFHPSDPQLAAVAIERYLFEASNDPWQGVFVETWQQARLLLKGSHHSY